MDSVTGTTHNLSALLRRLGARAAAAEADASDARTQVVEAQTQARTALEAIEALEAKARKLEAELAAEKKLSAELLHKVALLTKRLAAATSRPEQQALVTELNQLQAKLDQLSQDKYGTSSERRKTAGKKRTKKSREKKKTGHGPTPQPNLERTTTLYTLPEGSTCTQCGGVLGEWGAHTCDTDEVDVIERTFVIRVNRRQTYKCVDCKHLETAPGPTRLVPGGRYSTDFAITVAVDKYRDALPLARQEKRMAEAGLKVTRQTLWDQCCELYVLLAHNYVALRARILEQALVHIDETRWRMMKKGGSKQWWVWALTDSQRAYFDIEPSRGQAPARELLGDYDGIVVADRYGVYVALEKARSRNGGTPLLLPVDGELRSVPTPDYTLAACWMHGRRGFIRAAKSGSTSAEAILDIIGELYAVEHEAREQVAGVSGRAARQSALVEARRKLREARSRTLIRTLEETLDALTVVEGTALAKAVAWLRNGWEHLVRFLDDARIPLDNGVAERIIRGVVLGRNVYHGTRSELGARVAALFYSLLESCRLEGVDGHAYLKEAARRALKNPKEVFLPEDFARVGVDPP